MEQHENPENLNPNADAAADAPADAPKAPGVGDVAKELIRAGKSNAEVLEAIKEQFPQAKTSMASVNWYRNNLRQNGESVPTARELSAKAKEGEKAAKDAAKAEAKAKREEEAAAKKAAKAEAKAEEKRLKEEAKAKAKADAEAAKAGGEGGLDSALQ